MTESELRTRRLSRLRRCVPFQPGPTRRAITQRLHRQRPLRSKASARVGRRFLSSVQASWTLGKSSDTSRAGRSWRICRLSTPSSRHWKAFRNAKEAARAFAIIMSDSTEYTVACFLTHTQFLCKLPGRGRVRLDLVALMLFAKLCHPPDLADCWANTRVDGSPQWRVIGGCIVAQFVCNRKARSSSVGFCHVAFECWADGRPEQNRFSAVEHGR